MTPARSPVRTDADRRVPGSAGRWGVLLLTLLVAAAATAPAAAALAPSTAGAGSAPDGVPVARVAGEDRIATSLAVARDRFPAGQPSAVLARSDDFADALAGAALARSVGGPLLLTGGRALDPRVAAELTRHLPSGATVRLLGGPSALGRDVELAVAGLGLQVRRTAGEDRYATAAMIAQEVTGTAPRPCRVVLATGRGFADGAAAAGLLGTGRTLLFTDGDRVPPPTASALAACAAAEAGEVVAVGGPAAAAVRSAGGPVLPEGVEVTTVTGQDRYATSARVLEHVRGPEAGAGLPAPVVLARGTDFADPLVGATYGHPVLLTGPEGLPEAVAEVLGRLAGTVAGLVVVGGEGSVSPETLRAAAGALRGDPPADPAGPAPLDGPDALDAGWEAAWRTGDHEAVRAWFASQRFGPDAITGDHPGGAVRTQAQADALRGKRVVGDVYLNGDLVVREVFFDGGRVDVAAGDVTFSDVLVDARQGTEHPNYLRAFARHGELRVHFDRVEVRNGQDGIQTAGAEVTGRYVFVHSVAPTTGALAGNDTHQDGWQHMGGTLDVEQSFVDYRGARTSVVMLKPDHGEVPSARIARTVLQGGGPILLHVHDAERHTIGRIDVAGNLVAGTPGRTLASVWRVNRAVVDQLAATTVTVSPGGRQLAVRDAAKLP